jgi:hypothetical protein
MNRNTELTDRKILEACLNYCLRARLNRFNLNDLKEDKFRLFKEFSSNDIHRVLKKCSCIFEATDSTEYTINIKVMMT